jgi:hypothetical protein
MPDREWEAAISAARRLERIADDYTTERRWDQLEAELEAVVARFDCHAGDDLPAQALVALCAAWLSAIEAERQDQDWRDACGSDD